MRDRSDRSQSRTVEERIPYGSHNVRLSTVSRTSFGNFCKERVMSPGVIAGIELGRASRYDDRILSQFIAEVFRSAAGLEEQRTGHAIVTFVGIRGSSPQDLSAKMLVDVGGRVSGTVGGEKIDAAAIRRATALLDGEGDATLIDDWDLKRDIGMTCGGRISMLFEARAVTPWTTVFNSPP